MMFGRTGGVSMVWDSTHIVAPRIHTSHTSHTHTLTPVIDYGVPHAHISTPHRYMLNWRSRLNKLLKLTYNRAIWKLYKVTHRLLLLDYRIIEAKVASKVLSYGPTCVIRASSFDAYKLHSVSSFIYSRNRETIP